MAAAGKEATVTEPLKYTTWNLKVSIHCEGCKRKVKKVLHSIEGVYMTTIDPQKQKVTVTGNIEADVLIKKLIKTGKHAELWPEPKPSNPNSNGKNDNGGGKKKNKQNKNGDKPNGESLDDKPETKAAEPETEAKEEEEAESPVNVESGKDMVKDSPKTEKPAGKKKGKKSNNGGGNNNDSGGNGNGNNNGNNNNNGNGGGGGKAAAATQENQKVATVPHQQGYNLPMYPLPQYVVSYNNVQPMMAGSYYIPTMATVVATTGSYDFFSEENANACIVM